MGRIPAEFSAVATGSPETLDVFGASLSVLSDGAVLPIVVGEQDVPPGYGVPMHIHANDAELFYVLDGEIIVSGPGGETVAAKNACVRLPRGLPHAFRNASAAPARVLVVLTPGVQALEMFRHFDRAGRAAPLALKDIVGIAAQYGVTFA